MNRLPRGVALCLVACIGVAAFAAETRSRSPRVPHIDYSQTTKIEITDELRKDLLQFMLLRQKLFTPPQTCMFQTGGVCVIDVPVILLKDPADPTGNTEYCVALFPSEVHLPAPATGSDKIIVWSLRPPSAPPAVGPATFTFYDEPKHGIILLSDNHQQMHGGTLGDGTTPVDATKYLFRNKHAQSNEAVYLPIVVRTDNPLTPAKKVSVCGTPDPKIVND